MEKKSALRRRVTPSVPLLLNVEDADGSKFSVSLKLSYDFNAMALVEEVTGLSMLTGSIFERASVSLLSAMVWAGALAEQPEYEGRQGLEAIRSYMSMASVPEIQKAVNEGFLSALPKEQADRIREEMKKAAEAREKGEEPAVPLATEQTPATA